MSVQQGGTGLPACCGAWRSVAQRALAGRGATDPGSTEKTATCSHGMRPNAEH